MAVFRSERRMADYAQNLSLSGHARAVASVAPVTRSAVFLAP